MRTSRIHNLKIRPEFADSVLDGSKTFEIRKNDRNFQKGDYIVFCVLGDKPKGLERLVNVPEPKHSLTGKKYEITHVLADVDGLEYGYCILAIKPCEEDKDV